MASMRYEIRVDGVLTGEARAAFVDMRISQAPPQTVIDGEVLDESHLLGIIAQLQALGFAVVSVHPVPVGSGRASRRPESTRRSD
jgi:hypothetical protein